MASEVEIIRDYFVEQEGKIPEVLEQTDQAIDTAQKAIAESSLVTPIEKKILLRPITTYNRGRSLPRNRYHALIADLDSRGAEAVRDPLGLPPGTEIGQYYVQLVDDVTLEIENEAPDLFTAAYSPTQRTLAVSEDFSASNVIDITTIFHEADHMRKDFAFGDNPPEWYTQFLERDLSGPMKLIDSWEPEAYVKEMYLLNILTRGRLFEDARLGRMDIFKYLDLLQEKPSQYPTLQMTLDIAPLMVRTGTTLTRIAPGFSNVVNYHYQQMGYQIYTQNSQNSLRPIRL